ncbi:MAG: GNAT family N-acetyltransferase [Rhodoferax sp.]|nr:GNAT family N-acetyltransferase [Rhodoferax sp.]
MRELFQVVFGTPMSDALWHWKYANGRGVAMGVWNVQDELVAHYAGFPRQVLMFGKPVTAMQMGDVMVRPNERGTLSRKGPFFLATSAFLTRYVGYDQAALLGYGFPNDRHMQLGAKRGLYERNGKVVNLRCSAQRSALPWWLATRPFCRPRPVATKGRPTLGQDGTGNGRRRGPAAQLRLGPTTFSGASHAALRANLALPSRFPQTAGFTGLPTQGRGH